MQNVKKRVGRWKFARKHWVKDTAPCPPTRGAPRAAGGWAVSTPQEGPHTQGRTLRGSADVPCPEQARPDRKWVSGCQGLGEEVKRMGNGS